MKWYRFDVQKFGWQMLPPMLRGNFIKAFLRILLLPAMHLYLAFRALKHLSENKLSMTGQTLSIERVLKNKFVLHDGEIYITEAKDDTVLLYYQREGKKKSLYYASEDGAKTHLKYIGEGRYTADFIVHVPSYLRKYEDEIRQLIEFYKPAGRTYTIEYYDNE